VEARRFVRSLAFAAGAALALPAVQLALAPGLGAQRTLALQLLATAVLYVAAIAPGRRQAWAGGLAAFGCGLALLWAVGTQGRHALVEIAIGCALIVSVSRSVAFYGARPARALVLEVVLTGAGLLTARFLAGPGVLAMAAALWGYLLVQSLFFLAPGVRLRPDGEGGDPFERARARLDALLDEIDG